MTAANDRITAQVQEVQRIVREKAGLELHEQEIIEIHLLAMEPAVLAKSIVFRITGNVLDLADEGDDEHEARAGEIRT